jgi:C4-dicarboxylate transporter DctM subunit
MVRGMYEAAAVTAMLYMILMAAPIFTYFVNLAHVPEALVGWIGSRHFSPLGVIAILLVVYIVLGTFFEEMSSILITLPLVLPIVVGLGYDPLWWGIVCLIEVELAMIHPPMGIIVFLLHAVAPDIPMRTIYRGVVPFLVADFAVLILLALFPQLALWLPAWWHG